MKRFVIFFLTLSSLLFASQVHSFDVSKINHAYKHLTKPIKNNPPNSTWKAKSITTLHISELSSLSKHEKTDVILEIAATEGRINYGDYFYFRKLSNEFDYDKFPNNLLDCFKDDVCKIGRFIDKSPRKPVIWQNTQEIGRFGEHWTAKNMTAMGYTKLHSKLDPIHGIDGVYIQKNASGNITKIIVTESKVNKSPLNSTINGRQMSDQWIESQIKSMLNNVNSEVKKTGELLKNNPQKIEKQLWNINTNTGVVRVHKLDHAANKVGKPELSYHSEGMLDALSKKAGNS